MEGLVEAFEVLKCAGFAYGVRQRLELATGDGVRVGERRQDEVLEGVEAACRVHNLPTLLDFVFLGEPSGRVEVEARCDEDFSEARVSGEGFEVRLPEIGDGENGCSALFSIRLSVAMRGEVCRGQGMITLKASRRARTL